MDNYIGKITSRLVHRDVSLPQLLQKLNGRLYCFYVNKRANEYEATLRTLSRSTNAVLPLGARYAADCPALISLRLGGDWTGRIGEDAR
jgi:hypothetical protein